MSNPRSNSLDWALRLVPALILVAAIPAKFTAGQGAVDVFHQLGAEPYGRIATGIFESLAVLMLLLPPAVVYGALLTLGLMTGALLSHFMVLGVAPGGDPSMFLMASVAFLCALALSWRRRREIPVVSQFMDPDRAPTT
jgi:uncharacterized membrane protein YphA (DoxX/SURF4 family)